jgi:ABC-type uncharacterized transport system YnjBCD substrate-binding protein
MEERHQEAEERAKAELKARVEAEEQKAQKEVEARVMKAANAMAEAKARIETEERKAWLEAEARVRQAEETAKISAQTQLQEEEQKRVENTQVTTAAQGAANTSRMTQEIDQLMEDELNSSAGVTLLSDRPMMVNRQQNEQVTQVLQYSIKCLLCVVRLQPVEPSTIPKPMHFKRPAGRAGPSYRVKSNATCNSSPFY